MSNDSSIILNRRGKARPRAKDKRDVSTRSGEQKIFSMKQIFLKISLLFCHLFLFLSDNFYMDPNHIDANPSGIDTIENGYKIHFSILPFQFFFKTINSSFTMQTCKVALWKNFENLAELRKIGPLRSL